MDAAPDPKPTTSSSYQGKEMGEVSERPWSIVEFTKKSCFGTMYHKKERNGKMMLANLFHPWHWPWIRIDTHYKASGAPRNIEESDCMCVDSKGVKVRPRLSLSRSRSPTHPLLPIDHLPPSSSTLLTLYIPIWLGSNRWGRDRRLPSRSSPSFYPFSSPARGGPPNRPTDLPALTFKSAPPFSLPRPSLPPSCGFWRLEAAGPWLGPEMGLSLSCPHPSIG